MAVAEPEAEVEAEVRAEMEAEAEAMAQAEVEAEAVAWTGEEIRGALAARRFREKSGAKIVGPRENRRGDRKARRWKKRERCSRERGRESSRRGVPTADSEYCTIICRSVSKEEEPTRREFLGASSFFHLRFVLAARSESGVNSAMQNTTP